MRVVSKHAICPDLRWSSQSDQEAQHRTCFPLFSNKELSSFHKQLSRGRLECACMFNLRSELIPTQLASRAGGIHDVVSFLRSDEPQTPAFYGSPPQGLPAVLPNALGREDFGAAALLQAHKHDLRQLASTKADCLRCHCTVWRSKTEQGPCRKLLIYCTLVAETKCQRLRWSSTGILFHTPTMALEYKNV